MTVHANVLRSPTGQMMDNDAAQTTIGWRWCVPRRLARGL